jgi:hypothetical protein
MFGFRKSPANNKPTKQSSVNPPASFTSNPFDSDDESNAKQTLHHGKRTSSEPMLNVPNDAFDDRDGYKNDFRDSGGLENQSVQELEKYATYKAEETTKSVNNCLRIAEDIRQDATRTLDMLHAQGEQITRTHNMAVDMDKDLGKVSSMRCYEIIVRSTVNRNCISQGGKLVVVLFKKNGEKMMVIILVLLSPEFRLGSFWLIPPALDQYFRKFRVI